MGEFIFKAIFAPFAFAFFFTTVTLGSYIPLLGSPSLGLWHVSEQTVHMTITDADLSDADGSVDVPEAQKACAHVPFFFHAVASPPETVRVIVSKDGVVRGEMRVDCDTGQPISGSEQAY